MATKKYSTTEVRQKNGTVVESSRAIDVTNETLTVDRATINLADAMSAYLAAVALEKSGKEEKEKQAEYIRQFVGDVRSYFINSNKQYIKTFRLIGKEVGDILQMVDVSNVDRYTFSSNKEDLKKIKKELGDFFKQVFIEKVSIGIKKIILENDKKRKELTKLLIEKLGEDKINEYFDRSVELEVVDGLAEKMHTFPKATQDTIKGILKQSADTIKDTSNKKTD